MRVQLKFMIRAEPDAVWDFVRSPAAFQAVAAPLLRFRSLEPEGFAPSWQEGAHPVSVSLLGLLPLGEQRIAVTYAQRRGVRIMTDDGGPLSGPLAVVTGWSHRMAVAPARGGTLFRDRLELKAGVLTPLVWLGMWAFWQWRGLRLRAMVGE